MSTRPKSSKHTKSKGKDQPFVTDLDSSSTPTTRIAGSEHSRIDGEQTPASAEVRWTGQRVGLSEKRGHLSAGSGTGEESRIALYASYANHEAIAKRVPMTFHSWKRKLKADAVTDARECGSSNKPVPATNPNGIGPSVPESARYHLREHIFEFSNAIGCCPLWIWRDDAWRCKCGVALGGDNLFAAWMAHLEGT